MLARLWRLCLLFEIFAEILLAMSLVRLGGWPPLLAFVGVLCLAGAYIITDRLEVDLRAFGVEDVSKDAHEFRVLRKLCEHEADEVLADDEVIHFGGRQRRSR